MLVDAETFSLIPTLVSQSNKPLFRVEGLSVRYRKREVLLDTSIDIMTGKILALIGPSGCGKSTFLSCLNRLIDIIPGAVISGDISFDGVSLFAPECDPVMVRRRVGMIFQCPNPFPFTIRENLAFPLSLGTRSSKSDIDDRMEETLTAVGMWDEVKDRLHTNATELSGGQQQRLCIARALMTQPDVLLFDEPCSALDPISSAAVENSISDLRGKCTIVLVTHNIAQARRISDRTAVFWYNNNVGTIIEENETARLFSAPSDDITASYLSGEVA